jgi:hypothetical protein
MEFPRCAGEENQGKAPVAGKKMCFGMLAAQMRACRIFLRHCSETQDLDGWSLFWFMVAICSKVSHGSSVTSGLGMWR